MKIAILAELHANIAALESVLEAARSHSVDDVWVVGDIVGYGPNPRQVVRRIIQEDLKCVLGAADIRVAYDSPAGKASLASVIEQWTKRQLGTKEVAFLRGLRNRHRKDFPSGRLLAFHGSPDHPETKLNLEMPKPEIEQLLEDARCNYIVSAGRHICSSRDWDDKFVLDPGSVGLSLGGEPGADMVIVEGRLNTLDYKFVKVPYDYGQYAFDVAAWDLPSTMANIVRSGRYVAG